MLKGTFWSTEPVSEYFDGMMTYRKARFMIGKKSNKLFSLFSFWVHACIPCNFHILPVALHMPQKVCQLMMKQQSIIGWTIRDSWNREYMENKTDFVVFTQTDMKLWSVRTDNSTLLCMFLFIFLKLSMPKKLQRRLIRFILVTLSYLWHVGMR